VRSGKLSCTVENDRKVIDLAELIRVYGEPNKTNGAMSPEELTEMSTLAPGELTRQAKIEVDLGQKDEEIATLKVELRETRDKLKEEMDGSVEERSRLLGLLEESNKRIEDGTKRIEEGDNQLQALRDDSEEARKVMKELTDAINKPLWKKLLGR
jgi:septal ring factor EnvC (AmiA/AmiB activator)